MSDVPCQEPAIFAIGDTLNFKRYLPDFLPSDGWSLLYEVRGGAAGSANISFTSTTDGGNHEITVAATVTALWQPGQYQLAGFAVNAAVRHEIYESQLTLTPNLGTSANDADITTHASRMIVLIEGQLEKLAAHSIQDSTVQQSEFRRVQRLELEKQLAINKEIRKGELQQEAMRNGRPSGAKIVPQFNIVGGSCFASPFPISRFP